jgi:hypothetical protein
MPGLEWRAKHLAKAVALQIERDRTFGLSELADAIDERSPESIQRFIEAATAALAEMDVTAP